MSHWNYRVTSEALCGRRFFAVREVYYNEQWQPESWASPVTRKYESLEKLKKALLELEAGAVQLRACSATVLLNDSILDTPQVIANAGKGPVLNHDELILVDETSEVLAVPDLPADDALNNMIAEKLFGFRWCTSAVVDSEIVLLMPPDFASSPYHRAIEPTEANRASKQWRVPDYCHAWECGWQVVQWIREAGFNVSVTMSPGAPTVFIDAEQEMFRPIVSTEGSMPHAACLCALCIVEFLGKEKERGEQKEGT